MIPFIRVVASLLAMMQFINVGLATSRLGTEHPLVLIIIGGVCAGLTVLTNESALKQPPAKNDPDAVELRKAAAAASNQDR